MTPKIVVVILLLTTEFGYIQNQQHQQQNFQGFVAMLPQNADMLKMKQMKTKWNMEFLPVMKEGKQIVEPEMSSEETEELESDEKMFVVNKVKREMVPPGRFFKITSMKSTESRDQTVNNIKKFNEDVSMSTSVELSKSEEDSEETSEVRLNGGNIQVLQTKTIKVTTADDTNKFKRQTSIKGNGNRLSNLINLPIRLKVLANVLSELNQGVVDGKEKPLATNTITGNDNTVSSLVNAPIDVDAIVNILSKVDKTGAIAGDVPAPASGADEKSDGLVGGLVGGLLGGVGGGKEDKGLVGGLLGGLLGEDGLLGSVLGNTLDDLLGALLGNVLGGVDGKGLVGDLLNNLLGGVGELLDNVLELLVGILDALLKGLAGAGPAPGASSGGNAKPGVPLEGSGDLNIDGNNNKVTSLINAPIRINALINALSSLKQEIAQQTDTAAAASKGTVIQGNNNVISSLINLPIDADVKLNLLSSLVKNSSQKPASGGAPAPLPGATLPGVLSPNLPSAAAPGGTSIKGNKNVVSSLLNVAPDVNVNLNLLSEITDLLGGASPGGGPSDGIVSTGSNPSEICFDIPISQSDTSISGNNNKISNAVNVSPKINLDLNLLSKIKQTGEPSNVPTQRVCIIRPTVPPIQPTVQPPTQPTVPPPATTPAPPTYVTPSNPGEICFDVLVDQSGTVISGNNNQISSLVNVDPKINLGLNLLSTVNQKAPQSNLTIKRICIPTPTPPTEKPVTYPPKKQCYRRTCTRWRQFLDNNCSNKPGDYPIYTYTQNI